VLEVDGEQVSSGGISPVSEFLDKMRQKLGPMLFRQEFEGEFIDAESSAFSSEMIELALVNDFERFIQ
jgi:hypothetical protein